MRAYTGGGPDLIWYGAAATVSRRRSPGSGSWTATAGSWSATTTAATSLRLRARRRPAVPRPYAPVPRGRLRDRPAIPGLDPAAGRRRAPRGRRAAGVARAAGQASLDPTLLAAPRHSYDQTVARGISVNLSRPWHKGNHPGLVLARRLKRTAAQVWLFAARLDVPATNNGSENAIRGYKLAAKISGCWRTLATLQRHCRIRSYLTTARSHGRHPLAAIHDALNGNAWMPPQPA